MLPVKSIKVDQAAQPVPLNSIKKELELYQQECKLYHKLLLNLETNVPKADKLLGLLRQATGKTLPELQLTLRYLEGQSSNTTAAEGGQSHITYFLRHLNSVRAQVLALKYEVFDVLHENPVKAKIW